MTDVKASQGFILAASTYTAETLKASQAVVLTAYRSTAADVDATQALVLLAGTGRVGDPRVRAWTYSLDGHDFYVLRLGNIETLVCDLATGEWFVWGSGTADLWYVYHGANWLGGRGLGAPFGSDVVVGSDLNGALFFLSPEGVTDDDDQTGAALARPFKRTVTGQVVITQGYDATPCFGVQLMGSIGKTEAPDLNVTLSVSDDRGETYEDFDPVEIEVGGFTARANWQSLGSMSAPGRLFRITDYGVLQRVDALELEDGK